MTKYKRSSSKKSLVFLILAGVFIFLTANLLSKIQVYINRPEAKALVSFPKDHDFHLDYNTEWWYLNLMTRTVKTDGTSQKDLGYVLSFSRIFGNKGLLSSRYDQTNKSFNQKTDAGGTLTVYLNNGQYLFAQYTNGENYATLQEEPTGTNRKRTYRLIGKTDQIGSFNLILKERTVPPSGLTTPLLWGGTTGNCRGQISVFALNDTFYYSIPDLDITGTITDVDGVQRKVKIGKAWMDHQWFKSQPPPDWKGHYWTSFHFTESGNLYSPGPHQGVGFVTQIYTSGPIFTYWVKRNADGTNECGTNGNIAINNYGSTNYPSSWKIELKKSGSIFLQATGNSFSDNQIINAPFGKQFTESSSYYSGNRNGENFTGLGFFETHLTKPL